MLTKTSQWAFLESVLPSLSLSTMLNTPKAAAGAVASEGLVGMGCGVSRKVVPALPELAWIKGNGQNQGNLVGSGSETAAEAAQRMQIARFRAKFDPRVLSR